VPIARLKVSSIPIAHLRGRGAVTAPLLLTALQAIPPRLARVKRRGIPGTVVIIIIAPPAVPASTITIVVIIIAPPAIPTPVIIRTAMALIPPMMMVMMRTGKSSRGGKQQSR